MAEFSAELGQQAAQVLHTLLQNPATRQQALRLMKQANPGVPIPEIDEPDKIHAELAKRDEKIVSLETRINQSELERNAREARSRVSAEYGLSEEDTGAVEKLMKDSGISDFGTAAKFYDMERKLHPATATPASHRMRLPEIDLAGADDINIWARDEAERAINDLQRSRVSGQ